VAAARGAQMPDFVSAGRDRNNLVTWECFRAIDNHREKITLAV